MMHFTNVARLENERHIGTQVFADESVVNRRGQQEAGDAACSGDVPRSLKMMMLTPLRTWPRRRSRHFQSLVRVDRPPRRTAHIKESSIAAVRKPSPPGNSSMYRILSNSLTLNTGDANTT